MANHSTSSARVSPQHFSQTRWSLVLDLRHPSADLAARSLRDLSQRYWYPIYAYVRRSGHDAASANALCLAFFAYLPGALAEADPRGKGRFRDFLLDRMNAFLRDDWRNYQSLIAQQGLVPPFTPEQLESRLAAEPDANVTPTQAYHRSFALEVLSRSLRRLAAEAAQGGRNAMFEVLQPFLTAEPVAGQYQELAQQLKLPPMVVAIAVKRMRQRFRELAEEELLETVASPADLEAERTSLARMLSGHSE
ncbi:MAG: hypothetical protein JSS44_07585 [Proteobacteria bacterium]|nr:hypothetical protein [Pseudomonadota bacterium]MBS0465373.1 hypothetical protein [Pseudomonadota bacterium]